MTGAHQERALSYRLANEPDVFKPDDRTEVRLKKLADVEKGGGVLPLIEQPFDEFRVGEYEPLKLSNDEGVLKAMGGKLIAERTTWMMGVAVPEAAFGWPKLALAEASRT